ncbi:helix-turn-helix domain-containing protein [Corynebacterium diphtheriae]|nr:helix-turn-helix domain-containing protein [Corynebacterium diphtheriae]
MITLRHGPRLEDRFTMISNDVFQRADLSFRAKAIYGYLMSCRSGWQLTRDRIAEALEVSAGTIRRALEELEDAGYLVRSQSKGPDGRFNVVEYTIFSEPAPGSRAPRKTGKPADTVCTNLSNGDDQQKQGVSAGQTECTNLTPLIRTIKTKKNPPKPPTGVSAPKGGDEPTGELAIIEPAAPAKAAPASSRGCFLPDGWEPDREVINAMRAEFPHLNLWQEHQIFVDYWRGMPGARGRKRDWNATWRNWIRKAGKHSSRYRSDRHGATQSGLQGADARAATLVQMMNEITAENGL